MTDERERKGRVVQKKILALLREAGEESISGEEIAKRLGVSRTAIWKHIRALKTAGYEIESHPRKGYTLLETPDLLLPQEIQSRINTAVIGKEMVHFDDIPSSNEKAKELAIKGAPSGTVVIAEAQSTGKGRLSRGWFSPARKGIWFSVILRPDFLPREAPKCTLMAAVAIAEAMRNMGFDVGIKWPNDILAGGKKLVGILTEMNAEVERIHYVVIGCGVNVNLSSEDFPEDVSGIATSLSILKGGKVERGELFAKILEALDGLYRGVEKEGFGNVMEKWRRFSVTLGWEVNVIGVKETFAGIAADIDEDGALLIDTPEGRRRVLAGDVSVRPRRREDFS